MSLPTKTELRVAIDAKQLLSFRKILIERGLQPQQFINYIIYRINLLDERFEPMFEEALEDKKLKALERSEGKIDVDMLYQMIEDGLKPKE